MARAHRTRVRDLTGQTFGKLTVTERAPNKKIWTMWTCVCDCGNVVDAYSTHLIRGNTKSCGCAQQASGGNHVQWTGCGEISGQYWNGIARVNKSGVRRARAGLPFKITIQYGWQLFLKQERKCALSGRPIHFKSAQGSRTASLDRINSAIGYVEGNVQWVHKDVNMMKNVYSQEYFVAMCKDIAANQLI